MLDREKFDRLWRANQEWDRIWSKLDDIGIEASVLTDDLCEKLLEMLFYEMFPNFSRGDRFLDINGVHELSPYDAFSEGYYNGIKPDKEAVYELLNKNYCDKGDKE